jgi:hypothetical protein
VDEEKKEGAEQASPEATGSESTLPEEVTASEPAGEVGETSGSESVPDGASETTSSEEVAN